MDDLKSSAEVGYQLVKKKLITILNDMVSRTFNGAKLTFFFLELLLKFELCFHQKAKILQQNRYKKNIFSKVFKKLFEYHKTLSSVTNCATVKLSNFLFIYSFLRKNLLTKTWLCRKSRFLTKYSKKKRRIKGNGMLY